MKFELFILTSWRRPLHRKVPRPRLRALRSIMHPFLNHSATPVYVCEGSQKISAIHYSRINLPTVGNSSKWGNKTSPSMPCRNLRREWAFCPSYHQKKILTDFSNRPLPLTSPCIDWRCNACRSDHHTSPTPKGSSSASFVYIHHRIMPSTHSIRRPS